MPSPAKKRKLNTGSSKSSSLPSRGLEYFFSKQKQSSGNETKEKEDQPSSASPPAQDHEMTDEELARKLQAEWDKEAEVAGPASGSPAVAPVSDTRDSASTTEAASTPREPSIPPPEAKKVEGKGKGTLSLQSVAASVDTLSESIPFDESPLTFDPSKYVPQLQEHWASDGGNASYALLTRCFVLVNGTSSRIKIVDTLVNCLRVLIEGDPESLLPAASSACSFYILTTRLMNSIGMARY